MTAADGIASDHSDDRLGKILDDFLQVERVQARHSIAANVSAITANTLIPAGTEGLIARACENDHANLRVFATGVEGIYQFCQCLWPKGIAHLWPIDGDLADAPGFFKNDVRVVADLLPFY